MCVVRLCCQTCRSSESEVYRYENDGPRVATREGVELSRLGRDCRDDDFSARWGTTNSFPLTQRQTILHFGSSARSMCTGHARLKPLAILSRPRLLHEENNRQVMLGRDCSLQRWHPPTSNQHTSYLAIFDEAVTQRATKSGSRSSDPQLVRCSPLPSGPISQMQSSAPSSVINFAFLYTSEFQF